MFSKTRKFSPARYILIVYFSMIAIGTLLLLLPISTTNSTTPINALFTSTSAFCVTGLIVKDTAIDFTLFGKIVILVLIQIGGLGYMSFSNFLLVLFRKRPNLQQISLAKEEYGLLTMEDVVGFLKSILITAFIFELAGVLLLFPGFLKVFPLKEALNQAVFHSISAFCNAGFSTISRNISGFYKNPLVSLTIAFLVIVGGLGFFVLRDIYLKIKGENHFFSTHSKLIFIITGILIIFSTAIIFGLEYNNILFGKSLTHKLIISFFTAVTPRTAGFNVVTTSLLTPTTLLFLIIAMYIGASPGGTGGGIKTTTFGTLLLWLKSKLLLREDVTVIKRRISIETINKALLIFLLTLLVIAISTLLLTFTEKSVYNVRGFLPILFEEVSAFGTVGLSMGSGHFSTLSLAADFSIWGKLIIILTMIFGKAGPLMIAATIFKGRERYYRYPQAKILIG